MIARIWWTELETSITVTAVLSEIIRFVFSLVMNISGGEEILAQRKNIQALSDDTSSLLKQNVYQNYTQE